MRMTIPTQRKGQSTLEFIALFTLVFVFVIYFLVSKKAPYQTQLNATYDIALNGASKASQQLFDALKNSVP